MVIPDQLVAGLLNGQPAQHFDNAHQFDNVHQLAPPDSMQLMKQKPLNPVGPLNPIQEDPGKLFVPAVEINGNRMSNENNLMDQRDLNGAVEEMEDPQQRQLVYLFYILLQVLSPLDTKINCILLCSKKICDCPKQ